MAYTSGSRIRLWSQENRRSEDDPQTYSLIQRVEEGYGTNLTKNIEISKKLPVGYIWSWMEVSESYEGISEILEETKSSSKPKGIYTYYTSPERNTCLSLLNWPDTPKSLLTILKKLQDDNQYLRAVFIAILSFDYPKALEILKPRKAEERILYSILKSLVSDTSKSNMNRLCLQLSYSMPNNYSSTILSFLGGPQEFSRLIEKLPFPDNLAFALLFFNDAQVRAYCKRLIDTYRSKGDLNGIVITGFNSTGIEILENYLQITADLQTVALLSIYARTISSAPKLLEWSNQYKAKLNSLELWGFRAKLEIEESRIFRSTKDNLRTSKCSTCGTGLTTSSSQLETWSEKDYGKKFISTCENCPGSNTDLCCSVCLQPYLRAGSYSPFDSERAPSQDDWFVWCECCNHGAHADHLNLWFQEFRTCPVIGCDCNCDVIKI